MNALTITRPDDWHLHLRDGAMLSSVVGATARVFARAIVMPNLRPPVRSVMQARAYRDRILAAVPRGAVFDPLMTLYLTDETDPTDVVTGFRSGDIAAVKLYPAGATTNSEAGVTALERVSRVLEAMAEAGVPLLIHGEVTDDDVDIFDREAVFIERHLLPLARALPDLRIVLEHVTTKDAVEFVLAAGPNVAATITPHHLVLNRTDLFRGGVRPHLYCLPIAKREHHRLALRAAATSGSPKFFLGTDSAPHPVADKQSACGCAGIYCAPTAIETYAHVFEEERRLENLEAFASLNGPRFYGLAPNSDSLTLERRPWVPAHSLAVDDSVQVQIFRGGETHHWQVKEA